MIRKLIHAFPFCSALRFEHQMNSSADEKHYIGFKPSVTGCSGTSGAKLSRSSLTCEHWCRILHFGPPFLKTLSCYCIAEIFSQLPVTSEETMNDSERFEGCGMPISFFTTVTMVLQGSILGDCERNQKIAGGCLSRLLRSNALSSQQKQSVASSPWHHTLLENLMLSLSSNNLNHNPATVGSQASFSAAYVAVALLKMSPPPSYLPFLFSESSITGAIANLCETDISPLIVSFFHELLLSRYLTDVHVQILRDLFQVRHNLPTPDNKSQITSHPLNSDTYAVSDIRSSKCAAGNEEENLWQRIFLTTRRRT